MIRKLLIGAVCTLSVIACTKTVDGVLSNTEVLSFNVKNKTVSVPAGRWESKIKIPGKKEVKLEISTPGKSTVVTFKVLKGTPLPQQNGTFELLSVDSGQPYDVEGSVKTTHVDSEEQWQTESCTYQVSRQECHHGHQGQPVCHWVYYDVHGWRDVRFFVRETTQVVEFNLMSVGKTRTAGQFSGTDQTTERIYKYQSQCR